MRGAIIKSYLYNLFMNIKYFNDASGLWENITGSVGDGLTIGTDGWVVGKAYHKFVCNVNQSGTSNPTITEFENTIGLTYSIVYTDVGTYTITFDDYYLEDYNVWMQIGNYNTFDSLFTHLEDLTITITGWKGTATIYSAIGGTLTDDILRNASLEIRLYPLAP